MRTPRAVVGTPPGCSHPPAGRWAGRIGRLRLLLGSALGAVLLTSCVAVPSSGPVTEAENPVTDQDLTIRYVAPGPVPGMSPSQVVVGFLDAQQAFPASVETAAKFLTPDAAEAWRPSSRTVVYEDARPQGSDATVQLVARRVAGVSARGDYRPAPSERLGPLYRYGLERIDGEWRITNPPDATFVSSSAFLRYYRPYSLYFPDVTRRLLVPEPVWLPIGASLPTQLLLGLVDGPSARLGRAVSTAVPGATEEVSTVVGSDGVAVVRLPASAGSLSAAQRILLSAQLVRTLGQVPEVTGVRIMLGDTPLALEGVPAVQPVGSWEQFDPLASPARELYALRRGRLVSVAEGTVSEVSGRFGEVAHDIGDFDVELDGGTNPIAALSASGRRVLVATLAGEPSDRAATLYSGADLLGPRWDRYGSLWTVDRDGPTSRVLALSPRRARDVTSGRLTRTRVLSYALSPEGTRFAAVVHGGAFASSAAPATRRRSEGSARAPARPVVVLGRVLRDAEGRVLRVDRVQQLVTSVTALSRPLDVAWRDPTNVIVLARVEGGLPEPYTIRIDGSQVSGGPPGVTPLNDPVAIEVASSGNPQDPIYIGDRRGQLLYQDDTGRWVEVSSDPLRFPNFPN